MSYKKNERYKFEDVMNLNFVNKESKDRIKYEQRYIKSPFIYAGNKFDVRIEIARLIKDGYHFDEYHEPMMGSLGFGLYAMYKGFADKYYFSDINPIIVELWNTIKNGDPELIKNYINKYFNIRKSIKGTDKDNDMGVQEIYDMEVDQFNNSSIPEERVALYILYMKNVTNGLPQYEDNLKKLKRSGNVHRIKSNRGRFYNFKANDIFKRIDVVNDLLNKNNVVFEVRDINELFSKYKSKNVTRLIYLDPPYLGVEEKKSDYGTKWTLELTRNIIFEACSIGVINKKAGLILSNSVNHPVTDKLLETMFVDKKWKAVKTNIINRVNTNKKYNEMIYYVNL